MNKSLFPVIALALVPMTAACDQGPSTEDATNCARAFCAGHEWSPGVSSAKIIDSQISGNSAQVIAGVETRILKEAPLCIKNRTQPCVIYDTGPCGNGLVTQKIGDPGSVKLKLIFAKWTSGWRCEGALTE
jgi:hypothetical protein